MAKKSSSKRVAVAGGGILGLGILLGWLLDLWPNFGGPGTGESGNSTVVTVDDPSDGAKTEPRAKSDDSTSDTQAATGQLEVVDVLIDDYEYFLRSPKNPKQLTPVELERVVELAKQASGNEDGIRVRIASRANTRFSARQTLVRRLGEVGLDADAVFVLTDYVE